MKLKRYLVIKKNGSTRVTKQAPSIEWDEVYMLLNIEIPDKVFDRPLLQATITIDDKAIQPALITAEVVSDVENIIETRTGFEVKMEVINPNQ